MNQTDRIGQLLQKLVAGTHRDVSQCFPSRCLALLDQVSSEMPGPPAWKIGGKSVKEVAVENPLSRGGHTQIAVFGAFSKNGGRRDGCVLFGHRASLARQQQLQRWRVVMCIFEGFEWLDGGGNVRCGQ